MTLPGELAAAIDRALAAEARVKELETQVYDMGVAMDKCLRSVEIIGNLDGFASPAARLKVILQLVREALQAAKG